MPKSEIILNNNDPTNILNVQGMAIQFHSKYIDSSSIYGINIPHELREGYNEYFMNNNININKLCHLFIKSSREMKKLLQFSFMRFKEKNYG